MSKTPQFIIVGTMKSGTTSLARTLNLHPKLFIPEAELHFFNNDYDKGLDFYTSYFSEAKSDQMCGEKTPTYTHLLKFPEIPERIAKDFPQVKLIWIFRDPVKRAYSHFWHGVRNQGEICSFYEQLQEEVNGQFTSRKTSLLRRGLYCQQIKEYLKFFSPEQMHYCLFEDVTNNPNLELQKILKFLEIEQQDFKFEALLWENVGSVHMTLWQKLRKLFLGRAKKRDPLSEKEIDFLYDYYKSTFVEFEQLTGLSVDSWRRD